jgi:hypothetical protein
MLVYVDENDSIDFDCEVDGVMTQKLESITAKVTRTAEFQLAHAFGHIPCDPNYTVLHWALFGNLKQYYKGNHSNT